MSEGEGKRGKFKEVRLELQPNPRLITELAELLALAKSGKVQGAVVVYQVEGEDLSAFVDIPDSSRIHMEYLGQLDMVKDMIKAPIWQAGENR